MEHQKNKKNTIPFPFIINATIPDAAFELGLPARRNKKRNLYMYCRYRAKRGWGHDTLPTQNTGKT